MTGLGEVPTRGLRCLRFLLNARTDPDKMNRPPWAIARSLECAILLRDRVADRNAASEIEHLRGPRSRSSPRLMLSKRGDAINRRFRGAAISPHPCTEAGRRIAGVNRGGGRSLASSAGGP